MACVFFFYCLSFSFSSSRHALWGGGGDILPFSKGTGGFMAGHDGKNFLLYLLKTSAADWEHILAWENTHSRGSHPDLSSNIYPNKNSFCLSLWPTPPAQHSHFIWSLTTSSISLSLPYPPPPHGTCFPHRYSPLSPASKLLLLHCAIMQTSQKRRFWVNYLPPCLAGCLSRCHTPQAGAEHL